VSEIQLQDDMHKTFTDAMVKALLSICGGKAVASVSLKHCRHTSAESVAAISQVSAVCDCTAAQLLCNCAVP
jgi:hypothetical protein